MTAEKLSSGIIYWDDSLDFFEDRKLPTSFEDMGPHHLLVDLGKLADFIDMKNEHTFGKKAAIGLKCVGVFEL
jgi:hypothetical protein